MLRGLPRQSDPRVLIGFDTSDDAGVFQLTPDCALVQTVDFFTPIVDDPFLFGAIAAANSLSDVYAMGGVPISSLSILAWPREGDLEDLQQILLGGASKMVEAGCVILGGHSIIDAEPKFGYAVTGTVHPARVLANQGARPGDALVFTKSIGTGVIQTALKNGTALEEHVDGSMRSMTSLNKDACAAMLQVDAHACTDVTGFGLLGHAREMAAPAITLVLEADAVPLLPGALGYAKAGDIPGGLRNNIEFVAASVLKLRPIAQALEYLLYDPQTSGGLLIAMPEADVPKMRTLYPAARRIGYVTERRQAPIELV